MSTSSSSRRRTPGCSAGRPIRVRVCRRCPTWPRGPGCRAVCARSCAARPSTPGSRKTTIWSADRRPRHRSCGAEIGCGWRGRGGFSLRLVGARPAATPVRVHLAGACGVGARWMSTFRPGHTGTARPRRLVGLVVPTADAQRDVRSRGRKAGGKLTGPLLRSGAVVVAGFVLYAGSPPRQLWWTAPLAFAVFALTVQRRRAGAGFGYGLLFGMAFLLPLLGWLQDFLEVQFGPWPWLAVAVVEALFFGVAGAAMARVSRLPAAPLWMAMVFVAAELLRSSFPFGGFPWGRLAFTQISGPYLALASLGGTAAVTFAIALTGTGLAQLVSRLRGRGGWAVPVACALVPARSEERRGGKGQGLTW